MYRPRGLMRASKLTVDPLPEDRLEPTEVDGFLEFIFSEVARKPKELVLKEVSAVVRYLRRLVVQGLPKSVLAGGQEAIRKYASRHKSAE